MKGAKELDGKRVRLVEDVRMESGVVFARGTEGLFEKLAVVRCVFTTDDGRSLDASHMSRHRFEIVGSVKNYSDGQS